jgi:hypothetical protein
MYLRMHVCAYMYLCTYITGTHGDFATAARYMYKYRYVACIHLCMYVCYVCMYGCIHACLYVRSHDAELRHMQTVKWLTHTNYARMFRQHMHAYNHVHSHARESSESAGRCLKAASQRGVVLLKWSRECAARVRSDLGGNAGSGYPDTEKRSSRPCMYVFCTYVRMYVCMYVGVYIFTYICMCLRVYVCMICMICMNVCTYIYIYIHIHTFVYVCVYVCIYTRVRVCFYSCMLACAYVYVCMAVCMSVGMYA